MLEIWDFIVLLNLLIQLVWNLLRRYPDATGQLCRTYEKHSNSKG
jgi:hypothetical protein